MTERPAPTTTEPDNETPHADQPHGGELSQVHEIRLEDPGQSTGIDFATNAGDRLPMGDYLRVIVPWELIADARGRYTRPHLRFRCPRGYIFSMSRASRTPPRQRYHGWPNNRVGDPVYERLRLFVAGLDEFITAEIDAGRVVSRRAFAEAAGLPHSTLTKVINGDAVPDGLTIAALEVACGKSLWPSHHRAESSLKGE